MPGSLHASGSFRVTSSSTLTQSETKRQRSACSLDMRPVHACGSSHPPEAGLDRGGVPVGCAPLLAFLCSGLHITCELSV